MQIEYLVKPYQHTKDLPVNGCAGIVRNPFVKISRQLRQRSISPEEYLSILLGLWKDRIDYVFREPDSLFVMIDIFWDDSRRPKELLNLRQYAMRQLDKRFVSFSCGKLAANFLDERGYLDNPLVIHAYGEISNRCASGETEELVRRLKEMKPDVQLRVDFDKSLCPDRIEGKFN